MLKKLTAAMFQFLIGTVKTEHLKQITEDGEPVSIPHRYCKNIKEPAQLQAYYMFQFLIGTVKTELMEKKYQNFYMFQFLIGTVKTYA